MAGEFNRASQLWKNWEQKQQMLKDVFSGDSVSADLDRQKYDFLSRGMHQISRPSDDEKMVLELIGKATGKLEKQLYPHPVMRLLHHLKQWIYDKPLWLARQEKLQAANLVQLDAALNKHGFGGAGIQLAEKLDYQLQSIGIDLTAPGAATHNMTVQLHLEKDASGHYQLDGFTASLKDGSGLSSVRSYQFPAAMDVSAKEAFNLLEGRAVFKQPAGQDSGHWLQLDFSGVEARDPLMKTFRQQEGPDLKKELAVLAGELNRGELAANDIIKALERGGQVAARPILGEPVFLEADPAGRKVLLRDSSQQPITLAELKESKAQQKQEVDQSRKPSQQVDLNRQKLKKQEHSLSIS